MKGFYKKQEVTTPKRKKARISKMKAGCESCKAYHTCENGKFPVSGSGENGILIIKDTVSSQEEKSGVPLSGVVERYLSEKLVECGVDINQCWVVNACRCHVKGASVDNVSTAMKNGCRTLLWQDIKRLEPKKIIALGPLSVELLYGERAATSRIGGGNAERYYGCKIPDQDVGRFIYPNYAPRFVIEALSRRMDSLKKYNRFKPENVPFWKHSQLSKDDDFRLRDLYFKKYLKEALVHNKPFVKTNYVEENCHYINSVEEAIKILKEMRNRKIVGLDVETNMIKPFSPQSKLLTVGVSDGKEAYGFDYFGWSEEFKEALRDLITDPNVKTVFANLSMEALWFFTFLGTYITNAFWDIVLCSHMLLSSVKKKNSLKFNTLKYEGVIGYDSDAEEYISGKGDKPQYAVNRMEEMPSKRRSVYCAADCLFTVKVCQHQYKEMASDKKLYPLYQTYMKASMLFAKTSIRGFCVEEEVLIKNMANAENEIIKYERLIDACKEADKWYERHPNTTLNVNSNDMLRELFFDILEHDTPKRTRSGQKSVDADVLSLIAEESEIARLITERATWIKIAETLEGIRKNTMEGKIHPEILLFVASTGRTSSSSPNFQNVPLHNPLYSEQIRSCLYVPNGMELVDYDFKALEKRLAYVVHKDPVFLAELEGADSHSATAEYIFLDNDKATQRIAEIMYPDKESFTEEELEDVFQDEIRRYAKSPGFAMQFGCSPNRLYSTLWLESFKNHHKQYFEELGLGTEASFRKHAQKIYDDYWERFKVQRDWRERVWQDYLNKGYAYSLAGWKMSGIISKNLLCNSLIQGLGAYVTILAGLRIEEGLTNFKSEYILSIHDASYMAVDPNEFFNEGVKEIIDEAMTTFVNENIPWLSFPMEAGPEYCLNNWHNTVKEKEFKEAYGV